jgi:mRNA interferase MazF
MGDFRRHAEEKVVFPRRGDIYLVEFDPSRGHEIRKTRPAVIVQNDVGNRHSPITIVVALTSLGAKLTHPYEVVLDPHECGLSKASIVVMNQIRSVDRQRLIRRLGHLDRDSMLRIDSALKISLGLIEF